MPPKTRRAIRPASSSVVTASRRSSSVATCASARFFAAAAAAPWRRAPRHLLVWTVDEGAALRALLSRGADDVSVVSNAPFALQEELEALRVAQGCRIKHT